MRNNNLTLLLKPRTRTPTRHRFFKNNHLYLLSKGIIGCIIITLLLSCATTQPLDHVDNLTWVRGGIERGALDEKKIALVFTGGSFAEGADLILDVLKKHDVYASFFFTGDFLRNPDFDAIIRRIIREGHYMGSHSGKHPLYCPWDDRNKTLISKEEFVKDMQDSIEVIERFGVDTKKDTYWIPPYEWYNEDISQWGKEMGFILINFTPGTYSNADYTGEADTNFRSSDFIYNKILEKEENDPHGLNGFLLLMHIGAGPGRKDKFFLRLDDLLTELEQRGYSFVRVDMLLDPYIRYRKITN